MEVATTSNQQLRLLPTQPQPAGGTEGGAHSPFQREVREWQRVDPETGALLTGRLQADRWINGPLNSYGKISDTQNLSQPNGIQQTQRKQVEVLQARSAHSGAMLQVIRAQTSSRWSSTTTSASSSPATTIANNAGGGSHNSSPPASNQLHRSQSNGAVTTPDSTDSDSDDYEQQQHNHHQSGFRHNLAHSHADNWPALAPQQNFTNSNSNQQHNSLITNRLFNHNNNNNNTNNNSNNILHHHQSHHHALQQHSAHAAAAALLLHTAPSLKLSNLMKSTSSLASNNSSHSSNSNNSNNNNNTHKCATTGKISLHAIVGSNNNNKNAATARATTSSNEMPTTTWQQKQQQQAQSKPKAAQRRSHLYEQAALYGNSSNNNNGNNNKSSNLSQAAGVGVVSAVAAAAGAVRSGGGGRDDNDEQNVEMTPTQQRKQQHLQQQQQHQHRDLESFRHYNEQQAATTIVGGIGVGVACSASSAPSAAAKGGLSSAKATAATAAAAGVAGNAAADDDLVGNGDDLRLSARHQRRQQMPGSGNAMQRSRSISTDDLSSEWPLQTSSSNNNIPQEQNDSPSEWRRVSKLRRSFQSSTSNSNNTSAYYKFSATPRRPVDLPGSALSVAKIRAELESAGGKQPAAASRRLDLSALDTLLDEVAAEVKAASGTPPTPTTASHNTFLTAESLKEIRGKLKRLSDESLYRDDFVNYQQPAEEEHIEVQAATRLRTPERPASSAFQSVRQKASIASTTPSGDFLTQRTTNSLETRQKYSREAAAMAEWHLRRKSYGFEKMSPPSDKSMARMDASTDSGLGRSGELGNWSPTEGGPRSTVIQFGEPAKLVQKRYHPAALKPAAIEGVDEEDSESMQRHSIAVDECQYVRDNLRKISQVQINGLYDDSAKLPSSVGSALEPYNQRNTQQKRVEFCKTEVHFAAESGRVNIVETDGKPPPTQNFRRRRRATGSASSNANGTLQTLTLVKGAGTTAPASNAISSQLPITHFGDEQQSATAGAATTAGTTLGVAYRSSINASATTTYNSAEGANSYQESQQQTSVTVSTPKLAEGGISTAATTAYLHAECSRHSYTSTSGIESTDGETTADEISAIRGILKNKPIKPRPYHLGENIPSADALWGGVQPKPLTAEPDSPTSVAERVRIVERKHQELSTSSSNTNGYSTKINLSLGDAGTTIMLPATLQNRRPSAQELMLQDLREHQRMLDEGLKSTSLIIRTMRSANEFDEAMRRLSIASMEAAAATVISPIVVPTAMIRSHSYQETANENQRYANMQALDETGSYASSRQLVKSTSYSSSQQYYKQSSVYEPQPIAAPRSRLLGSAEMPVSQQLSQLRRMYEAAATTQDELDSADEEVSGYFRQQQRDSSDSGGGTQESSSLEEDCRTGGVSEYSGSWSRLKAKRTVWKIGTVETRQQQRTLRRAELPKSNVMNIELHSPQQTLKRPDTLPLLPAHPLPVAKPRSSTNATQAEQPKGQPSLRIVKEARGARKLREHELSYFGIPPHSRQSDDEVTPPATTTTKPQRTLPQRNYHEKTTNDLQRPQTTKTTTKATKWQLLNDKPDLLRHSPTALERKQLQEEQSDADHDDEHLYENISQELQQPVFKVKPPAADAYERKKDLKRDVMILSEMAHNADQTLKAISDEAALKDQRRRSLQRRQSKPLETIDEKSINAERINDKCIAVKLNRSTMASDAKRVARSRHATPSPTAAARSGEARSSSQSSVEESCPRARAHSLSSDNEYEHINGTLVRATARRAAAHVKSRKHATTTSSHTTTVAKGSKSSKHLATSSRSSSRESQRSGHTTPHCSSGDEAVALLQRQAHEERLRSKTKRVASSSASKEKRSPLVVTVEKPHKISSTTHSTQRERIECNKKDSHHHHQHEHQPLQRGGEKSSSCRCRRREELDAHKTSSSRSSSGKPRSSSADRRDKRDLEPSSLRPLRPARTVHVHERSKDAGKEREKLTRSRGHSSRSSSHTQTNATPTKMREHKKTTATSTATVKASKTQHQQQQQQTAHDAAPATMTHSKNAHAILNGHHKHQHQKIDYAHLNQQQHHQHLNGNLPLIQHSLTTATIAAKQRERSGKDRK